MYTVALKAINLKAMPYVTMDFERCKDSVSESIVDDIVTCDMGKLILLILESDSHVDRHIKYNTIFMKCQPFYVHICTWCIMIYRLVQDVYFPCWLGLPLKYTSGSQCKNL